MAGGNPRHEGLYERLVDRRRAAAVRVVLDLVRLREQLRHALEAAYLGLAERVGLLVQQRYHLGRESRELCRVLGGGSGSASRLQARQACAHRRLASTGEAHHLALRQQRPCERLSASWRNTSTLHLIGVCAFATLLALVGSLDRIIIALFKASFVAERVAIRAEAAVHIGIGVQVLARAVQPKHVVAAVAALMRVVPQCVRQ
mmetsp:Transcript_675/g.1936  ORF Transcript_675/g.1936 Transcript_675/m.1936 type:complete len:203 (+) Transcript_675:48-656(+)